MPDEPNISDLIHDRVIGHAIDLQRVNAGIRRDLLVQLQALERKLITILEDGDPGSLTTYQSKRYTTMLGQVRKTIATDYGEMADDHAAALIRVAKLEGFFTVDAINAAAFGVELASTYLSAQQLASIAGKTLIEGAPSRDWWERKNLAFQGSFEDMVRSGILRGATTPQIVRDLRGTKAANYADGLMAGTKRGVEALVRTSVQSVANEARTQTYRANEDVVKGIQWVATLDSRTTMICMALNGKMWTLDYQPIGHSQQWPGPTAHWNCRSTQISVLKSWQELGATGFEAKPEKQKLADYFEEELAAQGFSASQIPGLLAQTRSSMDGQVARDLTFDQWLKGKGAAMQDKMLGPARAKLFRAGKLSVSDLVDQTNRPLSLDELERKLSDERSRKSSA